ncbi:MAG: hypothetical protein AB7O32_03635 [Vicinamibacterales bacterium]
MARQPRCAAAGLLHLLELRWCTDVAGRMSGMELTVQRQLLADSLLRHRAALHAYAMVPARTLLLLTPESAQGPARLVQDMGRRFAVEMRHRHGHQGPVMAGRFRSVILQPESCLLEAMRYVEQLPNREFAGDGSVTCSSAEMHRGGAHDSLVSDHSVYWHTGNTPFEREALHRLRLAEPLPDGVVRRFEGALAGGWPMGEEAFLARLAQQLQRRLTPRPAGRPRKQLAN